MEFAYQDTQKSRRRILRPSSSLNSVNFANGSRISKISSNLNGGLRNDLKNVKPLIVFKQNEITEQLQKQITAIQQCLNQYKPFLYHIKQKQKRKSIRGQIFSIENLIQYKDNQIKMITQQVKHLKNINNPLSAKNVKNNSREQENNLSSEQNMKNSAQDPQQNNIFKLADELRKQKQFLQKLQTQHKTKQTKLTQVTQMVQVIQQKFVQKCLKTKQRPLRYEEFKELNQQKKRQIQNKANKRLQQLTNRQKQSSIKQMQFQSFNHDSIRNQKDPNNTTNTKKSLKSLQNRKIIAQQALKNARKKHNHQLTQLMAKIQFLRDQDTLLLEKIKQKEEQKTLLQTKFNEQKGTVGSFHLHMHHRLMSPSNRSSRDNRLNRFEGIGLNAKINNLLSSPSPVSNSRSLQGMQPYRFSPHRKLISARKGIQQTQTNGSDRQIIRKERQKPDNEQKGGVFYDYQLGKYDDYEQKTFNPNSKNSNKQSSTNVNDSNQQKQL